MHEKFEKEIQNFSTGVCKGGYADSDRNPELSSFKSLGKDRLDDFLKIFEKLFQF